MNLECFKDHRRGASRNTQSQTEWLIHLDSSESVQALSLKRENYIKIK